MTGIRLVPVRDMVVVRPIEAPPKEGLIVRVQLEQQPAVRGEVLAVGPETRDIQVGAMVIISRLQGYQLELGEPIIVLPEGAILATE